MSVRDPHNGSRTLIGKLVYNTVTTLYVGDKAVTPMRYPMHPHPAARDAGSRAGRAWKEGPPDVPPFSVSRWDAKVRQPAPLFARLLSTTTCSRD
jgi:hypothetical protein